MTDADVQPCPRHGRPVDYRQRSDQIKARTAMEITRHSGDFGGQAMLTYVQSDPHEGGSRRLAASRGSEIGTGECVPQVPYTGPCHGK